MYYRRPVQILTHYRDIMLTRGQSVPRVIPGMGVKADTELLYIPEPLFLNLLDYFRKLEAVLQFTPNMTHLTS